MTLKKLFASKSKQHDPDYDYVKFLLHMEGSAANVFTDDIGNTVNNTSVVRTSTRKRSGQYAAGFNGGNAILQLPNGAYCKPQAGPFLYEGSFSTPYEPSQISTFGYCLFASADGSYSSELAAFVDKTGLHFYWGSRGTTNTTLRAPFAFQKDVVYDYSIQRDEQNRISFWINSILVPWDVSYLSGVALNTAANIATNKPFNIGCLWQNQTQFVGMQDEMRCTIGKSRYPYNQSLISRPSIFPGR